MKNRSPFDDKDFIVTWLVGAIFIGLLVWFVMYGYVAVLNAAYDTSSYFVTKEQVDKAEQDGAIVKVNELEVTENFGTQDTWNPQQAGKNE